MQKLSYSLVFILTLLLVGCADAGQDKVVKSATVVVLEGNASSATVGGEIKKYKWKQISGVKVKIDNKKNEMITFTAPTVATEKILVFRLDTTEEGGHPNKFVTYDCVKVTVQPSTGLDTTAPVITLGGESNIILHVGETYVEKGARARDAVDGSVDVNITGVVDTDMVGKYTITYTAVDSAGNSASIERIVSVIENNDANETNITVKSISDDVSGSVDTATYNVVMSAELNESKEYSFSITGDNNITTPQPIFTDGVTYNAELETITVPVGIVDFSISIAVLEDILHEKEKFIITIDGVSNKPIVTLPRFGISDVNVTEEENNLTFIITLSDVSASDTIISVHTTSGTALEGQDYVGVSRDVIIPAGNTTAVVVVPVIDDAITENIETMTLNGTSGDTVNMSATGTGTIISWDDEDRPSRIKSISNNVSTEEGVAVYNVLLEGNVSEGTNYTAEIYNTVTKETTFKENIVPAGKNSFNITLTLTNNTIPEDMDLFKITINGVSNNPYLHPVSDNNNTQVENNNSITFEKGQYGDINLTVDWFVPNGAVFIDIREDWERIEARPTGSIGGAIYGNTSFVDDVRKLVNNTKNKQIILICHSGSRTTGAAELLSNAGFSNVWQIVGGMISWNELKPNEILTGALEDESDMSKVVSISDASE